jgi:carbon storage regulator
MLILSRRKNESLVINNDIVLKVVEIRGDKVRLSVVCPREVPVHRQEVFDAIHGRWEPRPAEELPFLKAISAEPGDEGARLVFADWLEERADPLGEFLRNQCRLVKLALDQRRRELEARQQALWEQHGAAWWATLPAALWSFPAGESGEP